MSWMSERAAAGAETALAGARDFARAALLETEPEASVGGHLGHAVDEADVVTHFFECRQAGYPGWRWAVTITRPDAEAAPTVVESQLVPGEGSLLAPDWVPWSDRLADYQAQQAAEKAAAESADEGEGSDDDEGDDDDLDEDDLDDDLDEELDGIDIDGDGDEE